MDKEFKRIIRAALKRGWRFEHTPKHKKLWHIASGRLVTCSTSPSDRNAYRNFARDLLRVEKEEA